MFEQASREADAEKRGAMLTFVVVGGGPTGVETARAIETHTPIWTAGIKAAEVLDSLGV